MAKEIVTLLPGPGRENGYISVIIADEGTESEIADLAGFAVLGLLIPTIDAASLTFQVSNLSTGTFYTVKAKDLAVLTIASGTGALAIDSTVLDGLKGYRFVKIKASAAQNGGPRTLIWIVKG